MGVYYWAVAGMAFCADALPERQEMLLCGVFLAVVAVSVFFLIYGGIQKSKYDIEAYNREYSPTPQEKRLQAICSLIMLTAAAMCLGMLIYDRGLIGVCWLTFPIGKMGLSSRAAEKNASSPQGYQWTGSSACWSR